MQATSTTASLARAIVRNRVDRRDAIDIAFATLAFVAIAALQVSNPNLPFVGGALSVLVWTALGWRARADRRWVATGTGASVALLGAALTAMFAPQQPNGHLDGLEVCTITGARGAVVVWPLLGAALTAAIASLRSPVFRSILTVAGAAIAFWIGTLAFFCDL